MEKAVFSLVHVQTRSRTCASPSDWGCKRGHPKKKSPHPLALVALLFLSACSVVSAQSKTVIPRPERNPSDWLVPMPLNSILRFSAGRYMCSAVSLDATHALTAGHCIASPDKPLLLDRVLELHAVGAITIDFEDDLALLELMPGTPPLPAPYAVLAEGPDPAFGEMVFVAGYGCFQDLDVRPAVFMRRTPLEDEYLLNGTVCQGDSGGPTFNAKGQLLSVHSRTAIEKTPLAFDQTIEPALTRLREASRLAR